MFKTAATKIAHNSTLPALGGNQDLRPLQDLITAEKAVLISLQKLSVDYSKAAEALRTWGLNEGDDLGDILSASTTLLNQFSAALSQYAAHGHVMRDQLKAIRTREEGLDDLKRRRRTLVRKAEDAEKKLSRMNPENKNLNMQPDLLNRLRDEIRSMDSDIMSEEAALGDFKRTATRMWMGLKFGGLSECCDKGTILAEFGKMIVSEIPEDITQPGLPRSLYYGHSKTEGFVSEASQRINEVTLSGVPTVGFRDRRQYDQVPQQNLQQTGYHLQVEGQGMGAGPWTPTDNKPQPLPPPMEDEYMSNPQRPYGTLDVPGSPATSFGGSFANYQSHGAGSGYDSRTMPLPSQSPPTLNSIDQQKSVDDFGMSTRSGFVDNSDTSGGRFATFPVKTRPPGMTGGYSLQDPPSLNARDDQDKSFSASIAEALGSSNQETSQATQHGQPEMVSPGWGRVNDNPPPPHIAEPTRQEIEDSPSQDWPGPTSPPPGARETQPPVAFASSTPAASLPPPPPGAAAPDLSDPWANAPREGSMQAPSHTRSISQISHGDDALLAYMTAAHEESNTTDEEADVPKSGVDAAAGGLKPMSYEEQQRVSRHVRFGQIEDVAEERGNRRSLEKGAADSQRLSPIETIRNSNEGEKGLAPVSPHKVNGGEVSPVGDSGPRKQHRVSPPAYKPEEDDEIAVNAAAAREVSRELEALNVNVSNPPGVNQQSQAEPSGERGRPPTASRGYTADSAGEPSPLAPPFAPFAKRTVSPHPYADLNKNPPYGSQPPYSPPGSYGQPYQNSSSPYGSPANNITPAQAYAQSYQSSTSYSQPQTPETHGPSSTLPPRFQALNQSMESQVPPRFQASGSPMSNQLPPRFQASGASQIPPAINLPEQQKGIITPLEYPRPLGASPAYTRSNTSLNTASSPVVPPGAAAPSGARTISAAAFKRPRNASTDLPPDPFAKKSLPSSPYPPPASSSSSSGLFAPGLTAAPHGEQQQGEEDDYDYISAYVNNSNPNSPLRASFDGVGSSAGQGQSQSQSQSPAGRLAGGGSGYGDGRFATNLENGNGMLR
ncbi:hypothetical protein M413DRAFT_447754 [Hebeloma cylindrosporum]|uniref:Eisosome component PIL1-domain-containing protein n=1 Tax=Hebeloma cylindrosporum TaxID=76867 RepID=A0A0C2XLB1_HEBCY|nr:hypothetical protein M413DRAFT_447754 [Hebeloma cylindrosporum h7]